MREIGANYSFRPFGLFRFTTLLKYFCRLPSSVGRNDGKKGEVDTESMIAAITTIIKTFTRSCTSIRKHLLLMIVIIVGIM